MKFKNFLFEIEKKTYVVWFPREGNPVAKKETTAKNENEALQNLIFSIKNPIKYNSERYSTTKGALAALLKVVRELDDWDCIEL